MKRISKTMATDIACKMVNATIGKKTDEIYHQIKNKATELAFQSVDKRILEIYSKFPDYIRTAHNVGFTCGPLHDLFVDIEYVPANDGYRTFVEISSEQYEWFKSLRLDRNKLEDESKILIRKIESTLLNLATPKRIKEQFPEAFAYLPVESETCTDIALPIEEIKELLLQYK